MAGSGRGVSRAGGLSASVLLHAAVLAGVLILPVLTPSALPEVAPTVISRVPLLAGAPRPQAPKPILPPVAAARRPPTIEPPTTTPPDEESRATLDAGGPPSPETPAAGGCTGCSFGGEGSGTGNATPGETRAQAGGGAPIRVGGQIEAPLKLRHVAPLYPEVAKAARVQGVIILECVIAADGRVTDIRVLKGHPLLEGAAVAAVREWLYRPPRLNGRPLAVVMTVRVEFRLPL